MKNHYINKRIGKLCFFIFFGLISVNSIASDFNLPFINAADLGNLYAGWAAEGNDASTAYTNPAGLIRLNHQQLIFSAIGVSGNTQFRGTTTTPGVIQTGKASGYLGGFIPLFYYAKPISDKVVFGFGENVPFGLGTDYGKNSIVRYAATKSQIVVIDLGPSLGVKINNQFSIGAGLDFEYMKLTLNNMYGPAFSIPDATGLNYLAGWGYGAHAGVLYQFTPATRVGMNYNTQVMFHPTGYSNVYSTTSGNFHVRQNMNVAMPALAQLSFYHDINARITAMASIFYTHWSTIQQVTLQNVVLPGGVVTPLTVPTNYHNTLDYAIGTNYNVNQQWILRAGMQFLNTPSNNRNRIIADPISTMILAGVGAHYQQNKCLGYDIGYAHNFFHKTGINFVSPVVTVSGNSTTNTDILGAQVTWNI